MSALSRVELNKLNPWASLSEGLSTDLVFDVNRDLIVKQKLYASKMAAETSVMQRRPSVVIFDANLRAILTSNQHSEIVGSRPSDHYFRSVCLFVCLPVCLFVCAEFFSAVFDPISIKLGHMLYVWV